MSETRNKLNMDLQTLQATLNAVAGKQDNISDLANIRSGAAAGSTALQPAALNDYATNALLSAEETQRKAADALMQSRIKALEDGGGASGENGATFTPSVSAAGVITWTNDKGLVNPDPVNIKGAKGDTGAHGIQGVKGDTGERGADGHTPSITATKSGSVTTIKADGVTIASINDGAKGDTGERGADGTDASVTATNIQTALGYKPTSPSELQAAINEAISSAWEGSY